MDGILKDSWGRTIDYLRISVTDRCNLRCMYCMPERENPFPDGSFPEFLDSRELLTAKEWMIFARAAALAGIRKIRLTGGEPLTRPDLPELVRGMAALPQIGQVVITTNAVGLARKLPALQAAGLAGVNVSLDSMDRDVYRRIAGRDGLDEALAGVRACLERGIPVKINCVPVEGINDSQWIPLAKLAREWPVQVRFIEMMPIGGGRQFPPVKSGRILQRLEQAFGPVCADEHCCNDNSQEQQSPKGPAQIFRLPGFCGTIGFISAVNCGLCSSCNRIRVTAEGKLKLCLHHPAGGDVRAQIRMGKTPEEISRWLCEMVREKPRDGVHTDESRPMWKIGG